MTLRVTLTRGLFALVDDEDAWVFDYSWFAKPRAGCAGFYACSTIGRKKVHLHRVVMDAPRGVLVDHANGDTLDCCKANLRFADPRGNSANSRLGLSQSGYRGVQITDSGKFVASVGGRPPNRIRSRRFDTALAAARKYDEMARAVFGEFAVLNFPEVGA